MIASQSKQFYPEQLIARNIQRRAVEAVIWGMPAVNFALMYQAMVSEVHGAFNQIVYWSRLPDWKNQTLTPNPDVIYLMPFFNTKEAGPIVLEIPPADEGSINGSVMDCWQTAIEDVGPAGVDKGKGGKFLILPPGYKDPTPNGYIAMPSGNYQGFALLRSILSGGSDADVAKAVAYGHRIKLYPFSKAVNPPATKFVDAIDVVFDATIPFDVRFFQYLDRMVQYEPWLERDKAMIDILKTTGIEKGRKFITDAKTQKALRDAIAEARDLLDLHYESAFLQPYFENSRWALPASKELIDGMSTNFADAGSYPVDARGLCFSFGFFSAKHLGASQFYLMAIQDRDGNEFMGSRVYHLRVPPDVPVTQYWSVTLYDRATHTLIRNMKRSSQSSQNPELQKNADRSIDVYFSPEAPSGKTSNWIPTNPDGEFEVLFRFYGPQKPLFDKAWKLPDVERI